MLLGLDCFGCEWAVSTHTFEIFGFSAQATHGISANPARERILALNSSFTINVSDILS